MRNPLNGSNRDRHFICMFGLYTFTSLYRNHVTEIVSKRLSTCTADRLNRCFKSTSACIESPYLETTENSYLYFTPGVVKSRDLTCPITACQANCNHRRTCVISKCVVVWKTVPFHDEKLMKNPLFIPESIPSRTETRKKSEFYDADFFGFNSKNKLDYIIKNTKGLLLCTALS